ncbi:Crp/Fnr family transcriptional regulator [Streptomyces sp. p1417]|uniref:Crp/Fnr family transcriptional regulator n=1 Tax=Streptomyces typhae TaxID=2681492 RepID=A0A6L6WVM3_9ACTN|nr:Crp/Fnr family transcriptional regulator [Streptomyces typhae]MVO85528.1 Crp/Fnr family transcriptional regulator [Streptomyces typhae]
MVPKMEAFQTTDVLAGRRTMPEGSFLRYLPVDMWPLFVHAWGSDARIYEREEALPIGAADEHVYIILGGYVRQERVPFGARDGAPKIIRFRGRGQLVGEAKLIEPSASVGTTCMTPTWVMPCPVARMNFFLRKHLTIQEALLRSLEDRVRSDETIYSTATRTPIQRVSGLLAHLADTTGTSSASTRPGHVALTGLSQKDLADALMMGVSTVENTLRTLREEHGAVISHYRKLTVTDLPVLRGIATAP